MTQLVVRARADIARMTDLQDVLQLAIKASALEAVIRRSGKIGADYYAVAGTMIWAEWQGGHLLRNVERTRSGPGRGQKGKQKDSHRANPFYEFLASLNPGIKKDTAYRWMTMAWVPEPEVAAYLATQEEKRRPLKRADLLAKGKALQPVEVAAIGDGYEILLGDLADAAIPDASVDCIITDPPYPREFLGEYAKLSALAARVLKPGGSCLAMAGQIYLPEVIAALATQLRYHWTLAYLLPGQKTQVFVRLVNNQAWKPVLWFVKGDYTGGWLATDVVVSDTPEKAHHVWGQSESGFARLVDRFTQPGDVVLDPFVGGGTTALAALRQGREFIGIDRDPVAVKATLDRIQRMQQEHEALADA